MELFIKKEKIFKPTTFYNDLLTNGVCEDFTKHIVPILREAGIDAHKYNEEMFLQLLNRTRIV